MSRHGPITLVLIPGRYDLDRCVGQRIAIQVLADGWQPQWTRLAAYLRTDHPATHLTLAEPILAPYPTPAQQARIEAPTQFRLIAPAGLAVRLDEPTGESEVLWL